MQWLNIHTAECSRETSNAIALTLSVLALFSTNLNQASAANLGGHHHSAHHGRFKRQADVMCEFTDIKGMVGATDMTIEQYCRCSDGSYGHECEHRFANPCLGNRVQFFNVPESLSPRYYVHCAHGEPNLFKCPAFLVWDDELLTCGVRYARESAVGQYDSFYSKKQVQEMYPDGAVVVPETQAEPVQYKEHQTESVEAESQYGLGQGQALMGGQDGQPQLGQLNQGGQRMDQQDQVVDQQRPDLNRQSQGFSQQQDSVNTQQGMSMNQQEMGLHQQEQGFNQQQLNQNFDSQGQGSNQQRPGSNQQLRPETGAGKALNQNIGQQGQAMNQQAGNQHQAFVNHQQGLAVNQQEMSQTQNQQANGVNQQSFSHQGHLLNQEQGQAIGQGMGFNQVSSQQMNGVKPQLSNKQSQDLNQQFQFQQTEGTNQQEASLNNHNQVSSQQFVNQMNQQFNRQQGMGQNQQGQSVSQQALGFSQQRPGSNKPFSNQQEQSESRHGTEQQQYTQQQGQGLKLPMSGQSQQGQATGEQFAHQQGMALNQQGMSQSKQSSSFQHGHALNQVQKPSLRPTASENGQFISQVNSEQFSRDQQAFLHKTQQQMAGGRQSVNQQGLLQQINNMLFNKQQQGNGQSGQATKQGLVMSQQQQQGQDMAQQGVSLNQQGFRQQGQGSSQQFTASNQQGMFFNQQGQVQGMSQQQGQGMAQQGVSLNRGQAMNQQFTNQQGQASSQQFSNQQGQNRGQSVSQQGMAFNQQVPGINQQSASQQGQAQSIQHGMSQKFSNQQGFSQHGQASSQQFSNQQGQGFGQQLTNQGQSMSQQGMSFDQQVPGMNQQGQGQSIQHGMKQQFAHQGLAQSNLNSNERPKFPTLPTQTQHQIFDYMKNRIDSIMSGNKGPTASRPTGGQLDATVAVKQSQTLSNVMPIDPFSSSGQSLEHELSTCGLKAQLQLPVVFQVTMKSPLGSESQSQLAQVFQFLQQQASQGIHVLLSFPPSQ